MPQIDPRAHPISVHYFFVRPRPELRLPGTNQNLAHAIGFYWVNHINPLVTSPELWFLHTLAISV